MKIETWNVNSIRVRLPHLIEWLHSEQPDILALQETKVEDYAFPEQPLIDAGYSSVYRGQKTYNGVALLSKSSLLNDVVSEIDGYSDPQKRFIAATIRGCRIVNVYVPNGSEIGSEKFEYKLNWLDHLYSWLEQQIELYPKILVLGDFNIAPQDSDVYDPDAWRDKVLCSLSERNAFEKILALGLSDCLREFQSSNQVFTWWDYRMNGFKRNRGLRIDHILSSRDMFNGCKDCRVDLSPRSLDRPSDHAPVVAVFG